MRLPVRPCCKARLLLAALPAACGLLPSAAAADQVSLPGIDFAAVSGNTRLLGVSGTGTLQDPFVLLEEITDRGDAIVAVTIHQPDFGSRLQSVQLVGFALTKRVVNRTDETWRSFGLELEQILGQSSDYYDGLSFAQPIDANRPFRSDRFANADDILEPRDVVLFSAGSVAPGETAIFHVAITHTAAAPNFYLVQRVESPYAGRQDGTAVAEARTAGCAVAADGGWNGSRGASYAHGGNIRDQDRCEQRQAGAGAGAG